MAGLAATAFVSILTGSGSKDRDLTGRPPISLRADHFLVPQTYLTKGPSLAPDHSGSLPDSASATNDCLNVGKELSPGVPRTGRNETSPKTPQPSPLK